MKRLTALICALLLFSSVYAQSAEDSEDTEDKFSIEYRLNEPGDQYIKLGLMVTFPLNFGGSFPFYGDGKLSTGGAGYLGYHKFITDWLAAGVDVHFGYNPTIGENIFTYIPFIFTLTAQPTYKKFEFPASVGIGFAMESYLNRTYFPGFIANAQAGMFYRVSPSWSFGIDGDFKYMPQWYEDSEKNDYGLFASFSIAARYHF